MGTKTIKLLDQDYILIGIEEEDCNLIESIAGNNTDGDRKLRDDLANWLAWRKKVIDEDQTILVCDPYGICNGELSEKAVYEEFVKRDWKIEKPGEATGFLETMFDNRNGNTIYGVQYSSEELIGCHEGKEIAFAIFMDVKSINNNYGKEYLVPALLHETTHYMEEASLGRNNCFGEDNNFESMKTESIWPKEIQENTLYNNEKWKKIFDIETDYQNDYVERMTTLIERIVIGSLYECGDRTWVETLKAKLKDVLTATGVLT